MQETTEGVGIRDALYPNSNATCHTTLRVTIDSSRHTASRCAELCHQRSPAHAGSPATSASVPYIMFYYSRILLPLLLNAHKSQDAKLARSTYPSLMPSIMGSDLTPGEVQGRRTPGTILCLSSRISWLNILSCT